VQQQADVLAFHISDFKPNLQANPITYFADLMSDFTRAKSVELAQLRASRDSERAQKLQVMQELERAGREAEKREVATR
jgi:hypothetical protein